MNGLNIQGTSPAQLYPEQEDKACHSNDSDWRRRLPELAGLPLLPCGAGATFKAPIDPKTGWKLSEWQHLSFTPDQIQAMGEKVTSVGTRSGEDAWNQVIIDIDGKTALEACKEKGAFPADSGWIIRRTTSEDRLKVAFRIPAEDLHRLEVDEAGTLVGKVVLNTKSVDYERDDDGKRIKGPDGQVVVKEEGNQIEVFFNGGQCVVLGEHKKSGGFYYWEGSPDAVSAPNEAWWRVIEAAIASKKQETRSARREAGETTQSGPGSPCPICGRDTSSACTQYTDGDRRRCNCYQGGSFSPPTHKELLGNKIPLQSGDQIEGADGRLYGFVGDGLHIDPIGWFSKFVEHVDAPIVQLRKQEPIIRSDVQCSARDLVLSIPSGLENGSKTRADAGDLEKLYSKSSQDSGISLRYNLMNFEVEVGGEKLNSDLQKALYVLVQQQGYAVSSQAAQDALLIAAMKDPYHPVRDFLNSLDDVRATDISRLASTLFRPADLTGDQSIYDRMLIKHLVGAVKRAFEPGCQHDQCLVLFSSEQGKRKDSFYKALFGDMINKFANKIGDKDGLLTVHSSWAVDLPELDHLTSKTHAGHLKTFIDSRSDHFRPPYGAKSQMCHRQCVFVGSTNRTDILQDETGARRWWLIPVELSGDQQINVKWVEENRLGIWKAALDYYRSGEKNYFDSKADERLNEELNQDYSDTTVLYDLIEEYFNVEPHPYTPDIERTKKDHISYKELLAWLRGKTDGESATKVQRMIKIEMARRGFEYKRDSTIEGRPRCWVKKQR